MPECKITSSEKVTVKTFKNQPIRQTQVFLECGSVEDAVEEIMRDGKPNILAVGETHPSKDSGTKMTPMKLFAEKALPLLKKKGFHHLVIENLYSDEKTDRALTRYNSCGCGMDKLESDHFFPYNNVNVHGLKKLLSKARGLSVKVYGGGVKATDQEKYYVYDPMLGLGDNGKLAALMRKVTQRTAEKTLKLLRKGFSKVITYNGGQHNDVVNVSTVKDVSFGKYFKTKTSYKYKEVDILSPEMMDKGHFEKHVYSEYKKWLKRAVPVKGVTLVKRGDSSYTIILPKGVLPK
jgi:hypothetical protein